MPTEILQASSLKLAQTETVRFSLDVEGETYVDAKGAIRLLQANGSLARPDSVATDFKVKVLAGVTLSLKLIIVGDQRWSTDLITGSWGPAPEEFNYDPGILFDNQGGIGPVMNNVSDATRLENSEVNGRQCYHLATMVQDSLIRPLTSNTMTGNPIAVDLWIDIASSDLRRVRLAEPTDMPGNRKPATWTMDLTDQGAPIVINPPV